MKPGQIVFWTVFSVVALLGAYVTLNFVLSQLGAVEIAEPVYDVSDIEAGAYKRFTLPDGNEMWVYHRTQTEIAEMDVLVPFLVDPLSVESTQPTDLRNSFRSANKEFFVFHPVTVKQPCPVKFSPASEFGYDDSYTKAPINDYNHFREPCHGNLFDTAGRVVKIGGYTGETNLSVPPLKWLGETQFQVLKPESP